MWSGVGEAAEMWSGVRGERGRRKACMQKIKIAKNGSERKVTWR